MNDFNWRNQPSNIGKELMRGLGQPAVIKPIVSGSIATPQPVKEKPGTGRSATA